MLPDFLLIGSPRCGTGYIAANMGTHPEIYVPSKKELHFFDQEYEKGLDYYESQFPGNEDGKYTVIGEATPDYLYFPEIPGRIRQAVPNCKLIASLRNPIDQAYSNYWLAYSKDDRTRKQTFEEKLETEPRLIAGGKYYQQLARYLELFPKEQLHIIIFEELIKNPEEEFRKLFSFIGVDENFIPALARNKVNSSGIALSKLKPAWSISNSRLMYYSHRLFLKYIRIPALADWLEKIGSVNIPPMAKETRKRLNDEFREDNMNLEKFLGRPITCWEKQDG